MAEESKKPISLNPDYQTRLEKIQIYFDDQDIEASATRSLYVGIFMLDFILAGYKIFIHKSEYGYLPVTIPGMEEVA